MNSLDPINMEVDKQYFLIQEEEGQINRLPAHVQENILSLLDNHDLTRAGMLNHSWNNRVKVFIHNEPMIFVKKILNGELYPEAREECLRICSEAKGSGLVDLEKVMHTIKPRLAASMVGLDERQVRILRNRFEHRTEPEFFDDFFDLALLFKQVETVGKTPNLQLKSFSLGGFVSDFLARGYADVAIKIAGSLPFIDDRDLNLEKIFDKLARNGKFTKAAETALMISCNYKKRNALESIVKELAKNGMTNEAIAFALQVPSGCGKSTLLEICKGLTNESRHEEAVKFANQTSFPNFKDEAMGKISRVLMNLDKFAEAEAVALLIIDNMDRNDVLMQICMNLAGKHQCREARRLADTISYPLNKDIAFSYISQSLAHAGRVNAAVELANQIEKVSIKEKTLEKVNAAT